jgi:hypothetical protein
MRRGLSSQFGDSSGCFLALTRFLRFYVHLTPAL